MAITVDPTVPADTADPRQGASNIRQVTSWMLQLFGFSGSSPVTLTPPNFANAKVGYCQFPNGLIIQWGTYLTISSGSTLTFATSFTTVPASNSWAVIANTVGASPGAAVTVFPLTVNSVTVEFSGGPFNISLIAVGF